MEKLVSGQSGPLLKKGRKKAAKDELDRLKQAEKKKRRLEKALATSAAICSQLEKKKQKRKEEEERRQQQQQRLDDEGAAIAEAVALHVLVGEDTDDSCHFMLNNNRRYNPSDHSGDVGLFMSYHKLASMDSTQAKGRAAHGSGCEWNDWEIDQSVPPSVHVRDFQSPFYDLYRGDNLSAGIIAAQAVSSLQIAEDLQENLFSGRGAATVVINQMMGGSSNMSDGLKSL